MKYALVKDGVVVDLTCHTPSEIFMPEVAEQYQPVPEAACRGDLWEGGKLITVVEARAVGVTAAPSIEYRQQVTYMEFQFLFTAKERAALKAATGSIQEARSILENSRNPVIDLTAYYVKDFLTALEGTKILTASRRQAIQRGEPPKDSTV